MVVQSGRRSQTLNKDLKGCKEGCGEEKGGRGGCHGHYPGASEKKREKKTHTWGSSKPTQPTSNCFGLFRAKFANIAECLAKFAASGKLRAEGRNKRASWGKNKEAKDGGGLKGEKGEGKKVEQPFNS